MPSDYSGLIPKRRSTGRKIPASEAGYMELQGARKDGDCSMVEVEGGISKEKGCCNKFKPESEKTERFSCGNCRFED